MIMIWLSLLIFLLSSQQYLTHTMSLKISIITLLLLGSIYLSHTQQSFKNGVNFQGNFDSMQHPQSPKIEAIDDEQASQNQDDEMEQRDMLDFAEHMADFLPDQTFTFRMKNNQKEEFMLWPGADVELIRGMFHSQVLEEDSIEGYINLSLYDQDTLIRNYKQQRLGIFNIMHNLKDHKYTFKFENADALNEVYFSYQFVNIKQKSKKIEQNETDISRITASFQKVNRLIVQQQAQMKRLLGVSQRHQQKVNNYLSSLTWAILFETFVISFGNLVSLYILKKQLYAGYELLV